MVIEPECAGGVIALADEVMGVADDEVCDCLCDEGKHRYGRGPAPAWSEDDASVGGFEPGVGTGVGEQLVQVIEDISEIVDVFDDAHEVASPPFTQLDDVIRQLV